MPSDDTNIRLALVTTELRPGGAERNMTALACGLQSQGFDPHIYSLAPEPPAGQQLLLETLRQAEIDVSFVNVKHTWQALAAVRRLRSMLQVQQPHLVQSFLFHANAISALAARRLNVPVVAGLRVAQREQLRAFIERRLAHRIDAFVCVSQSVAKVAETVGRLPASKLQVIPNGVDPERFADVTAADLSTYGIAADKKVILFVGRLDHQKGVDVLLSAMAGVFAQRKDTILLIIGEGPVRSDLQQQVEHLQLSQYVVFLPWQENPLPFIAAADVVAIPSRWEGMPNLLLEAMALERPFVVTDVEGVREVLGHIDDRQLPSPGDAPALAAALLAELGAASTSREKAHSLQQRLLADFSHRKMVAMYEKLYRNLISQWEKR